MPLWLEIEILLLLTYAADCLLLVFTRFHRALAARRANAERSSGVWAAVLALPPARPNETAAAFFLVAIVPPFY